MTAETLERGWESANEMRQDLISALEGVSLRMFTKILGWSHQDVMELIEEVANDIRSLRVHVYMPM